MLCREDLDLFLRKEREDLEVFLSFGIAHVEPELIELIRRSIAGVEPDVAAFGLSELASVGLCDEGACEGVDLSAELAADEFASGRDVAPLV